MGYKALKITLSDDQKAKLKSTFRNKSGVTIQFPLDQFEDGKDKILLTSRQHNKLGKHNKDDRGFRI